MINNIKEDCYIFSTSLRGNKEHNFIIIKVVLQNYIIRHSVLYIIPMDINYLLSIIDIELHSIWFIIYTVIM